MKTSISTGDNVAKTEFNERGFTVIRGFLGPDEVQEVLAQIQRYGREVVPGLEKHEVFYEDKNQPETFKYFKNMHTHDDYFGRMFQSNAFVKLAEHLLDGPVKGTNLSLFNKPARIGEATPPHQDGYYFKITPQSALTYWLAMDQVTEENGCVRYIPGSHRQGMRPHQKTNTLGFSQGIADYGDADRRREVAVPAEPGDLIVHHCLIIHRADANLSARSRRALGAVYFSGRAQIDEAANKAYTEKLHQELAKAGKI